MARLVVIVDEDVDPSDLAGVMWAVATRCEPSETVGIVRNAWSSALDPRIDAADRSRGQITHSKMITDACKLFACKDIFVPVSALTGDEALALAAKWDVRLRG
jgi:3-polyprenyl-4-hydroxybenzoate decarboxylase